MNIFFCIFVRYGAEVCNALKINWTGATLRSQNVKLPFLRNFGRNLKKKTRIIKTKILSNLEFGKLQTSQFSQVEASAPNGWNPRLKNFAVLGHFWNHHFSFYMQKRLMTSYRLTDDVMSDIRNESSEVKVIR